MVGWFAKKAQNSRVYMCIKEVKWTLEAADPVKRATILALAQLLRGQVVNETDFPADTFSRPLDYSRDELMRVYEGFENIRNQNNFQIDAAQKNMRRLGMELPQFSVDHAKNTGRSIELWMCTIGAGICPERRDDVRLIWSYLAQSYSFVPDAIAGLRRVERQTTEMTGFVDQGMFSVTNEDWMECCQFFPDAFFKELRFS